MVLFFYLMQFFGAFFPQNTLRVNVITKLSSIRLAIWGSIGYLAFKELYIYATEPVNRKASTLQPEYLWIPVLLSGLELLIVFRWLGREYHRIEGWIHPNFIVAWAVPVSIIVARLVYLKYMEMQGIILSPMHKRRMMEKSE